MYITRVKANRIVKIKRRQVNQLCKSSSYFVSLTSIEQFYVTFCLFPRLTHFGRTKTLPEQINTSSSYALMYSHTLQISSTVILPSKHQNQTVILTPTPYPTSKLNILIKHSTPQKRACR